MQTASLLFATVAHSALCKRLQDTELRLDTVMINDEELIKSYKIRYSTLLSLVNYFFLPEVIITHMRNYC